MPRPVTQEIEVRLVKIPCLPNTMRFAVLSRFLPTSATWWNVLVSSYNHVRLPRIRKKIVHSGQTWIPVFVCTVQAAKMSTVDSYGNDYDCIMIHTQCWWAAVGETNGSPLVPLTCSIQYIIGSIANEHIFSVADDWMWNICVRYWNKLCFCLVHKLLIALIWPSMVFSRLNNPY